MTDFTGNALRLAKTVLEALEGFQEIPPGGAYAGGVDLEPGVIVLKMRHRLAPRWKMGVAIPIAEKRDSYSIASAVAALLELPVQFQTHVVGGASSDDRWYTAGEWANKTVATTLTYMG
jgi:hypothetical protein